MKTGRNQYWVYLYASRATRRVLVKADCADSAYLDVRRIVRALGMRGITIGTQAA